MNKGQILFESKVIEKVETSQDLVHIKNNFHVPNPLLELIHSSTIRLYIGLSKTKCWLHYYNENKGYFLPNKSDEGEGATYFMLGNHYTEVKLKNCVTFDEVQSASVEFLSTGELPASLSWTEFK